ncbi:MAG: EcsC family protein [Chitinispirillia bacterium]|nr:EcsC family protein [Chitinispirillia bacterium]MCL2269679.1 EcsC family protein [Chitinispirillia bacterium]
MDKSLLETVLHDFEHWENSSPHPINVGLGLVTKPVAFALNPLMSKLAPLLEGVVSKANEYISAAVDSVSNKTPGFDAADAKSFEEWFARANKEAENWKLAGVGSLTVEGGATGAGGMALLLVDIPASFSLILGFANKIALTYGLPIKSEQVQIAILNAVCAGTANTLKDKTAAIHGLKNAEKILRTSNWKHIYSQSIDNVLSTEGIIVAVREFLKKMGINITSRKAPQVIPAVIGAAAGATINCAWAADALEAVRQFSRKWAVETYYSKSGQESDTPALVSNSPPCD